MKINELLDELESILKKNDAFVNKYFNKGILQDITKNKLSSFCSSDTAILAIADLLSWHNGLHIDKNIPINNFSFVDEYYLCSLENIIEIIKDDTFYNFKNNNMIPLFASGNGEYLVVNESKQIFYCGTWLPEIPPYTSIYDTTDSFITSVIECYKKGAYHFDDEGILEIDYDKSHEISSLLNPNSDFWDF